MTNLSIDALIRDLLATDPPRSKSLLVTLLGDAIEPHGGAVWIGTLIELLAPFGINERLVRTSIQRLTREGWLYSQRHGRLSRYSVTSEGRERIAHASERIYAPACENWNGYWTAVLVPPRSIHARKRSALRQQLEWEGYCMAGSGLFLHPLGEVETLEKLLAALDIRDQVYVFSATGLDTVAPGLADGVSRFWDLEAANSAYQGFIERFQPWLRRLRSRSYAPTPAQCFQLRVLAIHAFRRVSLHAPRLPGELYPGGWAGLPAYDLCRAIYQQVWEGAEDHLAAQLGEDGVPSRPDANFHARFGGLRAPDAAERPTGT